MALSVHEAVEKLSSDPKNHETLFNAYLDSNPKETKIRFQASEEWAEIKALLSNLKINKGSVLDLGAGSGFTSLAFIDLEFFVHYLEPDNSSLVGKAAFEATLTDQQRSKVKIHTSAAESLDLPNSSIDLVYSRQVLHHISDIGLVAKEVRRILKPSGYWIATREHVAETAVELNEFLASHPIHQLAQNEHAYTLNQYRKALGTCFDIKKELGHYDSAINFFPIKQSEIDSWLRESLSNKFSKTIADYLSKISFVKRAYQRNLSRKCKIPGRMYTFILKAR